MERILMLPPLPVTWCYKPGYDMQPKDGSLSGMSPWDRVVLSAMAIAAAGVAALVLAGVVTMLYGPG